MGQGRRSRGPALLAFGLLAAACAGPPSPSPGQSTTPVPSASGAPSAPASTVPSAAPSNPAPGWRLLADVGPGPAAREDHTWTLTPDAATAYLFGGRSADGTAFDDLWAYDLATDAWQQVDTTGPAARFGHNAAWVEGIGLVVFAGQAGSAFFNDLWAFDPASAAWRQLPSGGDVPVARYGSCAAVGPDGRLWISHGFTSDGTRFADTRAYDFASGAWTDETPPGQLPVARCLHDCWWTETGQLRLYGGQTTGVTALGDGWDLAVGPRQGTHAWNEIGATALPVARNLYAATEWNGMALVFGGQGLDGGYLDDLWVLGDADSTRADADSTRAIVPPGGSPPGRAGATLIGDAERQRILLFGGRDAGQAFDDLWELTLGTS